MKKNSLLICALIGAAMASSALAQSTPAGNNTLAPLSSESQAPSPSGQTDFQTDPFTGRFGYTVPLDLAPARHGSAPNLELIYNSANGNSWCGVGWDLDLGYIERETKYGIPVQWSGGKAVLAYDDSKGFLFSFKNKMSDLAQISSGTYRAQIESDFLQFQFNTSANEWVVTDKSGNQYYFGSGSGSRMTNPKPNWSQSGDAGTFRWALDTIITATGDKATISYTSAGGRLYPQTYSYNGHTAGINPLATVQFYLTTTNRTDTTISCRAAYAVTNQYLLSAITHSVNGQMVWSNKLNYTTSPSTMRSLLTSITRYGSDLSSTLPPLTFGYSQQNFGFQSAVDWGTLYTPTDHNSGDQVAYSGFNNPMCDLVDIDGDGLPDRVIAPDETESTEWWVQHNTGSGFADAVVWTLASQTDGSLSTAPDWTWAQFGTHGRVLDINGDGWPDYVVDPIAAYVSNSGPYTSNVVQLNNGTGLSGKVAWTNVIDQHSNPYYSFEYAYRAVEDYPYLGMLDMNGDGLPDRVMTLPGGYLTNYLVQFNTGSGYAGTNLFGPFRAQGVTNSLGWDGLSGAVVGNLEQMTMRMLDINGDGLPDRVMTIVTVTGGNPVTLQAQYQTNLVVELNNGYGFEPAMNWTNVNPYYNVNCGTYSTAGICDLGDDYQVAYRDINGDGLPDRIIACQCAPYRSTWMVQLNTGTGFGPLTNWTNVDNQGQTSSEAFSGIQGSVTNIVDMNIYLTGQTMLLDMNGDGLPDRVEEVSSDDATYYKVQLSSGPIADLLIAASNGLGGVVTVSYQPATHWDNRASTNSSTPQYLLPFPLQTVSSVSVTDGIYPANTTTYSYTGGYWSYALHQFDGFAQAFVTDPLNMQTVHWFHQAGGRNNSAFGEYQDSTSAIGKTGMEYRADTIGSDGNPYRTVLNQVVETTPHTGEHFAYVAQTINIDYPATSSTYKATAQQFTYNPINGNLLGETNWGQVGSVTISGQTFSDVSGDTLYKLITYASLSNTNIVDKPQSITLTDGANNILRQENYTYNGSTGTTAQENDLICSAAYRTTSYGYDSYNNRNSETDPDNVVTTTEYDSTFETFPTSTTEGGSFTTSTTYDPRSGKLYLSTDPAGLVTSNRYDAFLRLAETDVSTTPNGSTSEWLDKYTYTLGDSSGPQNSVLRQQSDGVDGANGHQTITWSDGLGRPIQTRVESEQSGQYRTIDTVYDQRGNLEFVSLPYFSSGTGRTGAGSGLGTLHGYDPIGRQTEVTASVSGSFSGGLLTGTSATGGDSGSPIGTARLAYSYTNDPWTWVATDETTNVHRYQRDAYGRTNQIVEVNGSQSYTTALSWNLAGDLLSVTDASNNVIQYANNLMGEVVAMSDPDMGVWTYQRDAAGRLRVQTDGDGQAIHYNYSSDPLGRLVSRQVYDLKGNFYYGVTNIYDANSGDTTFPVYKGQLYETIDGEGFTEYGYDVRGRKTITRRYLAKNGRYYTNQYAYDDLDRVTSIVYPNNGPTIKDIYDTGANLSQVQQVGGTTFYHATSFTPLDQIAGISYGNGLSATYSYYSNSIRLQQAQTSGNLQNLSYTYDAVGDILSISDGVYGDGASASISGVSYDGLHRLLGFTRPATSQAVSCTYDAIGNMLSYSENGTSNYTYMTPAGNHLPHAVKTANGLNYTYDLCGNMLTRGHQALVYNPENRLIASAVSNEMTTFGYDAAGNRLWKQGAPTNTLQVWIDGNYEEKDGKVLFHISAGDRIVYTFSADGSVGEYYHPDHLHSAQVMSTSGGGLYQHYEYAAYGNSRYTYSTSAFPVTRRYTSQSLDEETGLYYYGARYYDPVAGRFVQPDTLIPNHFDPQAYDRYAYALDNPLRYTDPSGHVVWLAVPVALALYFSMENYAVAPENAQDAANPAYNGFTGNPMQFIDVPVGMARTSALEAGKALATVGEKGVLEGGIKEGVKVGVKELGKEGGEKAGATILKNAEQGAAFEKQVGNGLQKTDESIASQVTLKTPTGNKTRMDFLSKDKKTGKINATEAKSSETAPLTPRQTRSHPEIETSGATIVGKGKPGFPGGTQIPPTKVNVVRPTPPSP